MRPRLVILSAAVAVSIAGSIAVGTGAAGGSSEQARNERATRQFVGYWMGIDPLDGGDSRRGITRNDDDTFSVIGRDTVFTLCDETDRAIITGTGVLEDKALVVDDVVLTCFGNGATLELSVRYERIDDNTLHETVTTRAGEPVDEILFHRVSER